MGKLPITVALAFALAAPAALADDKIRARLIGYSEVPSVSTAASGEFEAKINRNEDAIDYELTYSGLQGTVTQSHIHFGQRHTAGGISVWLCGTAATPNAPAGTQTCVQSGIISGTITAANVVGPGGAQQLNAGELAELIAAIRAGSAYVNVHSNISPAGEIRGQIGRGHGGDHDRGHDHQ